MNLKSYLRGIGIGMIVTAFIMGVAAGGAKNRMSDEAVRQRARELGMTESTVLADYSQESAEAETDKGSGGEGGTPETEQSAADGNAAGSGQAADSAGTAKGAAEDDSAVEDDGVTAAEELTGQSGTDKAQTPGVGDIPERNGNSEDRAVSEPDKAAENDSAAGQAGKSQDSAPTGEAMTEQKADIAEPAAEEGEEVLVTVDRGDGSDVVSRKLQEAGIVSSASAFDSFLCEHGYDKRITAGTHRIPRGAGDEEIARILTR